MSFQNSYGPDGSININVVPSFGHIVQVSENHKVTTVKSKHYFRHHKLKHGGNAKEHFVPDQLILIQVDMHHSL
jgi:hypothetical protein